MVKKCPELLFVQRSFPYEGQTVLHTLVSKENTAAVRALLEMLDKQTKKELFKMTTNTVSIHISFIADLPSMYSIYCCSH